MRRFSRNLSLSLGSFLGSFFCSALLGAEIENPEFYRIQPDTFGAHMSLSNAWGDYDADGYLDLYIGTNRQGNELYRNIQSQSFVEVTKEMGVGIPRVSARQISWIDFDGNGTLDLFVADRVGPNALFMKENNVFIEVSQKVGLDDDRATVGACWFDYLSLIHISEPTRPY